MTTEVFSSEWAQEWCRILNNRPAYQLAAANWEGAVALVMTRDGSSQSSKRSVFVDLWHGECRAARSASAEDLEAAAYILSGTAMAWKDVLSGKLAPLTAVMSGKIRLTKGSIAALIPYAPAARELVAAAVEMKVSFPLGW